MAEAPFDIFSPDNVDSVRLMALAGREFSLRGETVLLALERYERLFDALVSSGVHPETVEVLAHG